MNSQPAIASPPTSRVLTLVFTDLAGSLAIKIELGDTEGSARISEHFRLMRALLFECGGREIGSTGDGAFLTFETPTAAVDFALRLQEAHAARQDLLAVRVGVHMGEVTVSEDGGNGSTQVDGLAVDLASRLQSLALPGQILLTYPVFDSARQRLSTQHLSRPVQWMAHGEYLFKGQETGTSVFEAGLTEISPLQPPETSEKAVRSVASDAESTLGWRPAAGAEIPGRSHWLLTEKLGEGGFGDVWLAEHEKTRERRVFKFCYDPERLRSLKREVTLFRILKEQLGERDDMARVLDYQFDKPPFYLEMDYRGRGNLVDWAEAQGGLSRVPMDQRLEIIARIADALQAAHSVGVLHKDLKPSNVLVTGGPGTWGVRLIDFGIGVLASRDHLVDSNITMTGLTEAGGIEDGAPTVSGTRIYVAPELMEGKSATVQSDIFSLGVLFYQMVAGDLRRVLAPGWERHVPDALLQQDVADCIDGNPAERLLSAGELAERLRTIPQRRAEVKQKEQFATWRERNQKRRFYMFLGIIVALVGLAATGIFAYQQWGWRQHEYTLRGHANEARIHAEKQAVLAKEAQAKAETSQHNASIALAENAHRNGYLENVRTILLDDILPAKRGREWGWLLARTDESFFNIRNINVFDMEPSPDGKVIAAGNRDSTTAGTGGIYLYDAITGKLLKERQMHSRMIWDVKWSRDGKKLITSSTDQTGQILNSASLETLITLEGHKGILRGGEFSPDDQQIATIARDQSMKLWDANSGELLRTISLQGQRPAELDYHPTKPWIAISSVEGIVGVYHTESGDLVTSVAGSRDLVGSVRFTEDGRYLIVPSRDPAIRIYDTEQFVTSLTLPIRELEVPDSWPIAAEVDSQNRFLVIGCDDGRCYRQDFITGAISHRFYSGDFLWKLEMAPDGRRVYVTTRMAAQAFDLALLDNTVEKTTVKAAQDQAPANTLRLRVPGLVRSRDEAWRLDEAWETSGQISLLEVPGYQIQVDPFTSVYNRDRTARVVYDRRTLRGQVEAVATGAVLVDLGENVCDAAFSDDGEWLAVQTSLIETRRYKTADWERMPDLEAPGQYGCKVIFEPDSHRVLTAYNEGIFILWDIQTGEKAFESSRLNTGILSVNYSPDKSMLALGYDSNMARVFETKHYDEVSTVAGHSRYVHYVGFTPDSKQLITAARDGTARLWDAATGKELVMLYQGSDTVQVLAAFFTPDDSQVVILRSDGTTLLEPVYPWEVSAYPIKEAGSLEKALELWKRRRYSGETILPSDLVGKFD